MSKILYKTNGLDNILEGDDVAPVLGNSYMLVIINELVSKVNQYEFENKRLLTENSDLKSSFNMTKSLFEKYNRVLEYKNKSHIGDASVVEMEKVIKDSDVIPDMYKSTPQFKEAFNSLVRLYNRQSDSFFKL